MNTRFNLNKFYGNVLIIYGGGNSPEGAMFVRSLATSLRESKAFKKVFIGFYSFISLLNDKRIREWTDEEESNVGSAAYFGTCRGADFEADEEDLKKAIETCKALGIKYIYLAGGDGSARHMAAICKAFAKEGIHWVFAMGCTVDGINGGKGLGLEQAVKVSVTRIRNVAAAALRTLEYDKHSAVVVKLQGRNRDDILANVVKEITESREIADYQLEDVAIIAIPANYPFCKQKIKEVLLDDTLDSMGIHGKPVLILLSEGASITRGEIVELGKECGRKVRKSEIDYESQVSDQYTSTSRKIAIADLCEAICAISLRNISYNPFTPFTVVYDGENLSVEEADYYARKNPRQGQIPEIDPKLEELLLSYVPTPDNDSEAENE